MYHPCAMIASLIRRLVPRYSLRTLAIFLMLVTSGMGLWWRWGPCWVVEEILEAPPLWAAEVDPRVSPDGKLRVRESDDGSLHIEDTRTRERIVTLEECRPAGRCAKARGRKAFAWAPDGDTLVITWLGDSWPQPLVGLDYPDPHTPAACSGMWDAETGNRIARFDLKANDSAAIVIGSPSTTRRFVCAEWSPDGGRLITSSRGTVRIRDGKTGDLIHVLKGHNTEICTAEFSPDGRRIVSAGQLCTTRVWSAETGECLLSLDPGTPMDVASLPEYHCAKFSPCGRRIITSGNYMFARVRDTKTGTILDVLDCGQQASCPATYCPDGKCIATGGYNGATVYRRRRPEWWWGIFWLWEFWLAAAFAGLFAWSAWRDRRALAESVRAA